MFVIEEKLKPSNLNCNTKIFTFRKHARYTATVVLQLSSEFTQKVRCTAFQLLQKKTLSFYNPLVESIRFQRVHVSAAGPRGHAGASAARPSATGIRVNKRLGGVHSSDL
ncbi:hypothetical protein EVAR_12481_1 [Eumeta japonica]|uniref:Uncharacterized protein n=1 Tax=Eumeta variegata TaxID=151549 RepID=A0A4C1TPJ9_EUMVA|nr:hypothetical protein EVAR_12481_1 [Eumeta japonica]